jgi:plasmid stabilization system protein ParE
MDYQVELAFEATREIDRIVSRIWQDAPLDAVRWQDELAENLNLLTFLPERFALAAESERAPCSVRQIFLGKYRILYTVQEQRVLVLAIRHGHRLPMPVAEIRRRLKP